MESKSAPDVFELAAGELTGFAQRCEAMARTLDVRTVPHTERAITGVKIQRPADPHAAARAAQLRKVADAARARAAYLLGATAREHEVQRQQARADRERDATQLREMHELLDRLGAPEASNGSPRERLFYLIEQRGWGPNVKTPWGDDRVQVAPRGAASARLPSLLDGYQLEAAKTSAPDRPIRDRVFNGAMGLAGEAGEVVDLLKKTHFHDKPLDLDALREELGDVLWYVAELATAHGFSLEAIAGENIAKLRKRHGETFKPHAEQVREAPKGIARVIQRNAAEAAEMLPTMVRSLLARKAQTWVKASPGFQAVRVLRQFVEEFRQAVERLRHAPPDVLRPPGRWPLQVAASRFEREMKDELAVAFDASLGGESIRLQAPERNWHELDEALKKHDAASHPENCNCEHCR